MQIQKSVSTVDIGRRVRQLRKSKGITQDGLGSILGDRTTGKPLSRGQVSNLETGKRNFNIHQIKVLADFFNVSLETLGFESDEIEAVDLLERAKLWNPCCIRVLSFWIYNLHHLWAYRTGYISYKS